MLLAIFVPQAFSTDPLSQKSTDPALKNSQPTESVESLLPPLKTHPLPPTLEHWQGNSQAGDYFDQVQRSKIGYLIWSHFPITVYVEPVRSAEAAQPYTLGRSQAWVEAVLQAVAEWNHYLPLQVVNQSESADIAIWRVAPPIQLESRRVSSAESPSRPGLPLGRIRAAETRFELYFKKVPPESAHSAAYLLTQRFTIRLRPDQAVPYTLAAARHELGHALGIWGHSLQQTDALYFSQVGNPAAISVRDINTLKRIYEQPTRLGWELPERSPHLSANFGS